MASIKLRRGSGVPSGLTFGEPAFDITNSRLYVGITGGSALIGVAGGGVHTFNGLTGAVTGVTTGTANTFGPLQSFTSGISSVGGTFASQVNFVSGISASGGTFNNDIFVNSVRVGRGSGSIVSNVAVGANALNSNTTGTVNTAVGQQALQGNISGSNNTGIGRRSLLGLTTGDQNSALGTSSLVTLANGNKCLGLGAFTGQSLSLGTGSIYIGSGSDSSSSTTVNEIVIGTDTVGLGSNTTVIGPTTQVSATIRGLLNTPNGISSAGGTFGANVSIGNTAATTTVLLRGSINFINCPNGFLTIATGQTASGLNIEDASSNSTSIKPTTHEIQFYDESDGDTVTLNAGLVVGSGSYTVALPSYGTTLAGLAGQQTFTGLKSFSAGISASGGITFNSPIISNGYRYSSSVFDTRTSGFTLSAADSGKIFLIGACAANTIINCPTGLPVGFQCDVIRRTAASQRIRIFESGTTIESKTGNIPELQTSGNGGEKATILQVATNVYVVYGDI